MECCVGVSTETVFQMDKFYTVVKRIFKMAFWTSALSSDKGLQSETSKK